MHTQTHTQANGKQDAAIDKCALSRVLGALFLSSPPFQVGTICFRGVPPFRVGQLQPKNKDFNGKVFPTAGTSEFSPSASHCVRSFPRTGS